MPKSAHFAGVLRCRLFSCTSSPSKNQFHGPFQTREGEFRLTLFLPQIRLLLSSLNKYITLPINDSPCFATWSQIIMFFAAR